MSSAQGTVTLVGAGPGDEVARQGVRPPAVIVVGEVVRVIREQQSEVPS